ncbi:hypothetical protein [Acetobacter fallax]|nr:hypothetical protein [Acetobacter fallax]
MQQKPGFPALQTFSGRVGNFQNEYNSSNDDFIDTEGMERADNLPGTFPV